MKDKIKHNLKSLKFFTRIKRNLIVCCTCCCLFLSFFSFGFNDVYADSTTIVIDGVSYVVDSFVKNSKGEFTSIVKDGVTYSNFGGAYTGRKNLTWAKLVAGGVMALQDIEILSDMVGVSDTIDGWVLDGVEYGKSWLADGWNSIQNQLKNGTLDSHGSLATRGLLGGLGALDNIRTDLKSLVGSLDRTVETSFRNYFEDSTVISGTNSYVSGNTRYYPVANTYDNTFYNTYNNTYETINNYTYDIKNNYYNYYTTENHYHVQNTYNNTYVFSVGGNYDYELYYKLPDGSNSYNLTEEDIYGIKLDLNVDNYERQNSNNDVLGLYHLNGNNLNTYDLENSDIFEQNNIYFPYSSNNYVDSLMGFDTAYMDTRNTIFKINNTDIKNIRFYLYGGKANATSLTFYPFNLSTISIPLNANTFNLIELNGNDVYVNGVLQNINTNFITENDLPNVINPSGSINFDNPMKSDPVLGYACDHYQVSYSWSNLKYILTTTSTSSYYKLKGNLYVNVRYQEEYDDPWRTYTHTFTNIDSNSSTAKFYRAEPNYQNTYETLDGFTLTYNPRFSSVDYYILDELRLSNILNENHGINYLPFNDGIYYTLPNIDTNNKLLIKSDIAVNDFQFGGIRKGYSNSIKGDVFVNLTNNYIDTIEQFDGHDWISVDGAIYSTKLGKWVNAIGYSVLTGDWTYSDITSNDVKDTSTLAKWLGSQFNDLKDTISKGFESAFDGLKDLIGVNVDNALSIDGDYDVDVENDLSGYLEDVQSIDNDISVDLDTDLGDSKSDVIALASHTSGIFDAIEDNGLSIIWVAPLIIAIVRLVI